MSFNILRKSLDDSAFCPLCQAAMYWMDAERTTALIDSPGFQEFGLHHIEPTQLASLMPDMRAYSESGECKFYNCSHLHEPGCKVIGAEGISPSRYKIYTELHQELRTAKKRYWMKPAILVSTRTTV